MNRSLHKLDKSEKIFKKFKISKNLIALIDFGEIQDHRSFINIFSLRAVLVR